MARNKRIQKKIVKVIVLSELSATPLPTFYQKEFNKYLRVAKRTMRKYDNAL